MKLYLNIHLSIINKYKVCQYLLTFYTVLGYYFYMTMIFYIRAYSKDILALYSSFDSRNMW